MLTFEKNFAPDQDGRTPFAFAAWRLQMCDLAAELSFDPQNIGSAGTFSEWQLQVKVRLRQLLHIPAADPTQPPPKLLESRQRDTYTVNLYEAYPDKWSKVRFLMLVPENISAPVPLVLCFPGSHHPKEALAGEPLPDTPNCPPVRFPERNCMALHYVKAGYAALAFDNPGTAMSAEIDSDNRMTQWGVRTKLTEGLLAAGSSYPAFTIYQRQGILDWALALDWIDKERVAVSGHSLGSEAALFMSVLDDRIKALVFNDFVCDERIRYCAVTEGESSTFKDMGNWHCIPGIWQSFTFPDLLASLAPKYLALNESGAEEFLDKIRQAYSSRCADDHLQITYYPEFADTPKYSGKVPRQGLSAENFYEKYCAAAIDDHSFRAEPSLKLLEKAFK